MVELFDLTFSCLVTSLISLPAMYALQLRVARGYQIIAGTAAEVAVMVAVPVPADARVPLFDHHAHRCSWSCLRGSRRRLPVPPRQHTGRVFLHLLPLPLHPYLTRRP